VKSLLEMIGYPSPESRDVVRFFFLKNLSYTTRIRLSFFLALIGFLLQIYFLNLWSGILFIAAASLLMTAKGFDSRARLKSFSMDSKWTEVPLSKLQEIEQLRKKISKWDSSFLDVSNALGCFGLILVLGAGIAFAKGVEFVADDSRLFLIVSADLFVLFLPLWFTGMRFILKQPVLHIKIKIVQKMSQVFKSNAKPGESFKPSLMLTRKESKTVPTDARFMIDFFDSPDGFYGLQAQININTVQGHKYPYFYCVLAAERGFGLARFQEKVDFTDKVICEYQEDKKAEVLVIRQFTTKKSGYHTKDPICGQILEISMRAGRLISETQN
jgi:hypothetical protein